MSCFSTRLGILGPVVLSLAAAPALADTGAGLAAFKNKDYQKAYKEWKAAAEAGEAEAQFDLGVLYAQGLGVRRDLAVATSWYRKAAEQGNAEAQFAMGQMYARGWGVPRDTADALRWFQMANQPDSDGPRTDWAVIEGHGIQQDAVQAVYWYRQAADKGHPEAQYNLAAFYANGKGVKRDEEQAARWVSAAASQGYALAMSNFGARCAAGNGVAKDDRRSYFWLTLAYLHGERGAEKLRSAEAAKLPPTEVADQDRAAQNWKPRMVAANSKL